MTAHWSARYVGRPHTVGDHDCARLAADIQREAFGRAVALPAERPGSVRGWVEMLRQMERDHGRRLDAPVEGCIVLMRRGNLARPWHVGVWFERGGEGWIIHSMEDVGVITSRARLLHMQGLQIEGYYEWITQET